MVYLLHFLAVNDDKLREREEVLVKTGQRDGVVSVNDAMVNDAMMNDAMVNDAMVNSCSVKLRWMCVRLTW